MRSMGTLAEACGYGLKKTDNTKCVPPSIPSYKTKSQPVQGRANKKTSGETSLLWVWFVRT